MTAASKYDLPAKETMPIRSLGRDRMKFFSVSFAAIIRDLPLYCFSLASMDSEMSSAIMMSTPLAFLSL